MAGLPSRSLVRRLIPAMSSVDKQGVETDSHFVQRTKRSRRDQRS